MASGLTATSLTVLPSGYVTNIIVGGANITRYVPLESLEIEQSGNQQIGSCSFLVKDVNITTVVRDKAFVSVVDSNGQLFKGFIESRAPRPEGLGREVSVVAHGIESLLDTVCILENIRTNGESDKARIQYFLQAYGGQGLYNNSFGSTDTSKIQVLRASMPDQKFKNMTLRQVIESILGLASESSDYYVDPSGRIHTFDSINKEPNTAPYIIRLAHTLGVNEIAPEEHFEIDYDSQGLINDYYVRAKSRAYDTRRIDAASIQQYGRFTAFVDAPDADTLIKAERVGDAALADNAQPKVRGSLEVSSPYDVNGNLPWQVGQYITIYSNIHDFGGGSVEEVLIAESGDEIVTETGEELLVSLAQGGGESRIVTVRLSYLAGDGQRKVNVSFGGDRLRLRSAGTGNNVSTGGAQAGGAFVTGEVG